MIDPNVTEDELHAYVDGELPADRRAAVEQWLASHPDDAVRVAAWHAQADAIRARYDAVAAEPVPQRFDLAVLARKERKWSRVAVAATLAAFILGGGAGWFGRSFVDGAGPTLNLTVEAFEAHRLYIGEVRHPIEVKAGEEHLNRWLSRRIGYPMPTPNLGPLGLKLLGGRLLPGNAGRPAALYMYEGATGERFTVYSRRDAAPQSALRYRASGPIGSFFWVEDEQAFVVSGPAEKARLQKIAESVYEQIETRQQTGELKHVLAGAGGARR
jgi:anti-sigma factor RsiW